MLHTIQEFVESEIFMFLKKVSDLSPKTLFIWSKYSKKQNVIAI